MNSPEEKNDSEEKNDPDNLVIPYFKKIEALISQQDQNSNLESLVGKSILIKFIDRYINNSDRYINNSDSLSEDFYNFLKSYNFLLNPNENLRNLLVALKNHGVMSVGLIHYLALEGYNSPTTIRLYLKRMEKAGLVCRYSTDPIIKACEKKPLTNLKHMELYGFHNLPFSAYESITEFYKLKTEEAYEKEMIRANVIVDKKRIMKKVLSIEEVKDPMPEKLSKHKITMGIDSYKKTIDYLNNSRRSTDKEMIPYYEDKIRKLEEQLKELD